MSNATITNVLKRILRPSLTQGALLLGSILLVYCFLSEADVSVIAVKNRLKFKLIDVIEILKIVAGAGFIIGTFWFVISLLKGEPNYRYALILVVGGSLLYCVIQLVIFGIRA